MGEFDSTRGQDADNDAVASRGIGNFLHLYISSEALQAVDPSLVDMDINHIHETLQAFGPE